MAKKRVVVKTPTNTRCKYVAVEAKILNCGKVWKRRMDEHKKPQGLAQ